MNWTKTDDSDFKAAFEFLMFLRDEAFSAAYQKKQKSLYEQRSQMAPFMIALTDASIETHALPPITPANQQVDLDWSLILQELSLHTRVRVDVSPGKGRGLFAARDFKKGELILMEKPLLAASVDNRACHHCLKISNQLSHACSCKVACCSADCLELMKKYHICSETWNVAIKSIQVDANSSSPICLLILAKFYGYLQNSDANRDQINKIKSLTLPSVKTGVEAFLFSDNSRWQIFRNAIGNQQFTDFRWYKEAERRILANGFSISCQKDKWKKLQGNGVALFLVSSMPNHSCRPNAGANYDQERLGAVMKMNAVRDIKKGEEITLAYLDENLSEEEKTVRQHVS